MHLKFCTLDTHSDALKLFYFNVKCIGCILCQADIKMELEVQQIYWGTACEKQRGRVAGLIPVEGEGEGSGSEESASHGRVPLRILSWPCGELSAKLPVEEPHRGWEEMTRPWSTAELPHCLGAARRSMALGQMLPQVPRRLICLYSLQLISKFFLKGDQTGMPLNCHRKKYLKIVFID